MKTDNLRLFDIPEDFEDYLRKNGLEPKSGQEVLTILEQITSYLERVLSPEEKNEDEKKFRIDALSKEELAALPISAVYHLTQTYLAPQGGDPVTERRRRKIQDTRTGEASYIYTRKQKGTQIRPEINIALPFRYYHLLADMDSPENMPIEKMRYVIPYEGQTFELDQFPEDKKHLYHPELPGHDIVEIEKPGSIINFHPILQSKNPVDITEDSRWKNGPMSRYAANAIKEQRAL